MTTQLLVSAKIANLLVAFDLQNMWNWFISCKLNIQKVDKCEEISLGSGKPKNIKLLHSRMPYKNSCKFLGLHFDSFLRYRKHVGCSLRKLIKICRLIFRQESWVSQWFFGIWKRSKIRSERNRKCSERYTASNSLHPTAGISDQKATREQRFSCFWVVFKWSCGRTLHVTSKWSTVEILRHTRGIPTSLTLCSTGWGHNRLFCSTYSSTITNRECLENAVSKKISGLKWIDSLTNNLSFAIVRNYVVNFSHL